jgi:dihydroneopterin aldolase
MGVMMKHEQIGLIELEEMEFYAYHGCFKEEQVVGNKFAVNLSFKADCSIPSQTDSISDAVNYVEVYEIVKREMMVTSHLLEHVAGRIVNGIMDQVPQIVELKVKVSKLNPPVGGQLKRVSVTFEKQR